jgi:hypothetical protein
MQNDDLHSTPQILVPLILLQRTVYVYLQHEVAHNRNQLLSRITLNPKVLAGEPVIRGTRPTVQYILGLLAHEQR